MTDAEYTDRAGAIQIALGMTIWTQDPHKLTAAMDIDLLEYVMSTQGLSHPFLIDWSPIWVEACKKELAERFLLLNES
jgi:hypothetical protein